MPDAVQELPLQLKELSYASGLGGCHSEKV